MKFSLAEKLAIVKAVDKVISADKELDNEEVLYLKQLMRVLDFDISFLQESKKISTEQALLVLNGMDNSKKNILKVILEEMAGADGTIDAHEKEVISFFSKAGIKLDYSNKSHFEISDIYFESSNNKKYKKGEQESSLLKKEKIAIKIEPLIENREVYSVSSFNLEEEPALWGSNIQMPSKQMKIIKSKATKTILRGVGEDPRAIGEPEGIFSNFGVSIFHPKNKIERIIIHRHDQEIHTEYLR